MSDTAPAEPQPLILWAGNVLPKTMAERADAAHAGGFASTSLFTGDIAEYEASGGSLVTLKKELQARGVAINCVDPYAAWYPDYDVTNVSGEAARMLIATEDEVLRYTEECEAPFITIIGPFNANHNADAPFERVVERLAAFVARVEKVGARAHVEPIPTTKIPDLATAMALIEAVNRPSLGLLLDTYNFSRAGVAPAELESVPLEAIFQIQIADGGAVPVGADYQDDGGHHRRLPGEGDLPVAEMIRIVASKGPLPPCGPEAFSDDLWALPAAELGRRAASVTRAFLGGLNS